MSSADVFALAVFLVALLAGMLLVLWQARRAQRPEARIRARISELNRQADGAPARRRQATGRARSGDAEDERRRTAPRWLAVPAARIRTLGGKGAWLALGLAAGAGVVAAAVSALLLDLAGWVQAALFIALPLAFAAWAYGALARRFRKRFLDQLPQAIDMVMRASMAGVPPTQAIRNVGADMAAPLGPEFRDIGDSLYLGEDLEAVMREAMERIAIPEFSFFGVYLMVQRSTGGSMGETLQNLSAVIRSRSELDLKVRAMTAEGRASSLVMAILPFAVFGIMFLLNRDYARVLFQTEAGRTLLLVSLGMIAVGMLLIRRMARLED